MSDKIEEAKKSEKYTYFRSLGYTEKQATVLSLFKLDSDDRMQALLSAYLKQKEQGFVDFVLDHYDSEKPFIFDEEEEEETLETTVEAVAEESVAATVGDIELEEDDDLISSFFRRSDSVSHAREIPAPGSFMFDEDEDEDEPVLLRSSEPLGSCIPNLRLTAPRISGLSSGAAHVRNSLIEKIRTDSYEPIEEKSERNAIDSPTATFRPTYNTAAAGVLLSNIRKGSRTSSSMVRTEELLNYLSYDLKKPEGKKFEVTKELKKAGNKTYLFLGVQGEKAVPARQNICLLLDVSGSMCSKTDSIVMVLATVLAKMNPGDLFSLVTYACTDDVIIDGLTLNEDKNFDEIAELIAGIEIDGYTNGSSGINKAYDIIERNKIEDGVNRVILITDGDLNFGIHDKDGLKGLIEKKRETGAYFSAIGTGIFNLKDDKLEALAKNGNGNYFVVNEISDVRKTVLDNYEALVYPIAKNVKAQMEFNPGKVKSWKLVGYENRMLNHEDFRNDKVIAEPFGSGSCFVALFELDMKETKAFRPFLKYQKTELIPSEDLGTLTVRFEDVNDNTVKELEFTVEDTLESSENIEKAITCAEVADRLRKDRIDGLTRRKISRMLTIESIE
ncbi:MAG: von Willebrand factor type A domain-containing protein [Solobacterium sp.]|nr:von Willebrand factor type A domain-containing protein [Solobacterium sp.]